MIPMKQVRELIEQFTKVEVKKQNQYGQTPVFVTDINPVSSTSGWKIVYYPKTYEKGMYDLKESFQMVIIKPFSFLYQAIKQADQQYALEQTTEGREYDYQAIRIHISSQIKSTSIKVQITDEQSPFNHMNLYFNMVNDEKKPGVRHLIGEKDFNPATQVYRWTKSTDEFVEHNAQFGPAKVRFVNLKQVDNVSLPMIDANVKAIENGFTVDKKEIQWISPIDNEYKALAYAQEQMILKSVMKRAFELVQHAIHA